MGVFDTITESFGNLKKKITGVAENPTPSPLSSSNAMAIRGGAKRSRSKRSRSKRSRSKRSRSKRSRSRRSRSKRGGSKRSGSKRRSRKSVKKVRFSKKNKVYTYKRK